jgi:AAA+ ATPase superfamily predicted ATPase
MKKLYNRQRELNTLQTVSDQIVDTKGQLSVMVGRRRVGKTRLLNEALHQDNTPFLYLFISRKSESALVAEFAKIIHSELGVKFFQPQTLRDIIEFLLDYTKQKPLTIILDEFQDIDIVNPLLCGER